VNDAGATKKTSPPSALYLKLPPASDAKRSGHRTEKIAKAERQQKKNGKYFFFREKIVPLQADYYQNVLNY
jgi:hypothetical protein